MIAAGLGMSAYLGQWVLFGALACYFFGAYTSHFAFLLAIVKGWPFTERVMDWEKIQKIADGEI